MLAQSTINFISDWEKRRKTAYDDGYGNLTIGIGHNIKSSGDWHLEHQTLTEDEIDNLFRADYKELDIHDKIQVIKKKVTQWEYDALASLIFTLGYLPKSIAILVDNKQKEQLRMKWLQYTLSGKKKSVGLYRRRRAEIDMFFNQYKGRNYYDSIKAFE